MAIDLAVEASGNIKDINENPCPGMIASMFEINVGLRKVET